MWLGEKMTEKSMVGKKAWKEFRESGLLWFINTILHVFGWAIVIDVDLDSGNIIDGYPARCKFRGFDEESTAKGYENVTKYLQENIFDLVKDLDE